MLAHKYLSLCKLFPGAVLQSVNVQLPLKIGFLAAEEAIESFASVKKGKATWLKITFNSIFL